jgi:ApaG protein
MTAEAAIKSHGSDTLTDGVRVRVVPSYVASQSDPGEGKFVFAYRITITNEGDRTVRLRSRRWMIVDGDGERRDVEGPGVVGQFPTLAPGEAFEYSSFCPLQTPWGTMEGTYEMETLDGTIVHVAVGRFYLVSTKR